jgi:hypothetical protein
LRQEAGSIATITISGYYYIVGFLTILALGGKCVPIREFCIRDQYEMRLISLSVAPSTRRSCGRSTILLKYVRSNLSPNRAQHREAGHYNQGPHGEPNRPATEYNNDAESVDWMQSMSPD